LTKTILEHKEERYQNSFSTRYNLNKLVYFEQFQMVGDAIIREKQFKAGNRALKKINKSIKPEWNDLQEESKDIMII